MVAAAICRLYLRGTYQNESGCHGTTGAISISKT